MKRYIQVLSKPSRSLPSSLTVPKSTVSRGNTSTAATLPRARPSSAKAPSNPIPGLVLAAPRGHYMSKPWDSNPRRCVSVFQPGAASEEALREERFGNCICSMQYDARRPLCYVHRSGSSSLLRPRCEEALSRSNFKRRRRKLEFNHFLKYNKAEGYFSGLLGIGYRPAIYARPRTWRET